MSRPAWHQPFLAYLNAMNAVVRGKLLHIAFNDSGVDVLKQQRTQ